MPSATRARAGERRTVLWARSPTAVARARTGVGPTAEPAPAQLARRAARTGRRAAGTPAAWAGWGVGGAAARSRGAPAGAPRAEAGGAAVARPTSARRTVRRTTRKRCCTEGADPPEPREAQAARTPAVARRWLLAGARLDPT